MSRPVYEVTGPGFDGSSDGTDHLVLWIEADSEQQVRDAIKDYAGARLAGQLAHRSVPAALIDYRLPKQAIGLMEALNQMASDDRNRSRA